MLANSFLSYGNTHTHIFSECRQHLRERQQRHLTSCDGATDGPFAVGGGGVRCDDATQSQTHARTRSVGRGVGEAHTASPPKCPLKARHASSPVVIRNTGLEFRRQIHSSIEHDAERADVVKVLVCAYVCYIRNPACVSVHVYAKRADRERCLNKFRCGATSLCHAWYAHLSPIFFKATRSPVAFREE